MPTIKKKVFVNTDTTVTTSTGYTVPAGYAVTAVTALATDNPGSANLTTSFDAANHTVTVLSVTGSEALVKDEYLEFDLTDSTSWAQL